MLGGLILLNTADLLAFTSGDNYDRKDDPHYHSHADYRPRVCKRMSET